MKSQLQLNMQGRFTILEGRTCVFAVSTDNDCLTCAMITKIFSPKVNS